MPTISRKYYAALVFILVLVLALLMYARGKTKGDESHTMLPAGHAPHTHRVSLDGAGSGVSTRDATGHQHSIESSIDVGLYKDGKVVPADHAHDVTAFIVDK